jgi:hypothetical protein
MMKGRTYPRKTGRPGGTIPGTLRALVSVFLVLAIASGCSRPIKPKSDFITVKLGDITFTRYFDLAEKVEFEGEQAILLSDFIDSVVTERPAIYAYRIIGSDGFYAHMKGSPDNAWEHMQKGYLKLSNRKAAFDPSLGLEGRYYVKDVAGIELLRKIETRFAGDGHLTFFLIAEMETALYSDPGDDFYDGRSGVKLADFVDTLISAPEEYSYDLVSIAGEKRRFSWAELQTGWWILDLDLTKFYPDLGPDSRIPYLQSIELIPNPTEP